MSLLEITAADKRRIFEEVRQQDRDNRKRKRPNYTTISVAEAKSRGYRPVTSGYSTRQFDQCAMLDAVVLDFKQCDIVLVRLGAKNVIEVWRKFWEQKAPSKSTTCCTRRPDLQALTSKNGQKRPKKDSVFTNFVYALIGKAFRQ